MAKCRYHQEQPTWHPKLQVLKKKLRMAWVAKESETMRFLKSVQDLMTHEAQMPKRYALFIMFGIIIIIVIVIITFYISYNFLF